MEKELIYDKPITISNVMRFTIPSMLRMIFISMYSIVDGIVVSNYVGSLGLSAINIVYPVLNLAMAFAFMFASGGNAIIGKLLGEGEPHKANRFMTSMIIINVALIAVLATIFLIFDEEMYYFLGSDDEILPYCKEYGTFMVLIGPIWVLQVLFQNFLITADKPKVSMTLTAISCCVNIVLDFLFVGAFNMGIRGAAFASICGILIGGLVPIPFFVKKTNLIHFEKPLWDFRNVLKAMGNGASEMVSNLSCAITTTLYNWQMMAMIGEKGVAAISAALYIEFFFVASFFGFTGGISPLISYNYGAKDHEKLEKVFKLGFQIMIVLPFFLCILSEILCVPLVNVFASNDPVLSDLMVHGFRLMALCIATSGIGIYGSAFFTALNNGKISAIISFLRTFLFEAGSIILLPYIIHVDGIWLAMPVADLLAGIVAVALMFKYRKKYGY